MATFSASVASNGRIVISRDNLPGKPAFRLDLSVNEGEKLTSLLGTVLSTSSVDRGELPDHLTGTPFVVRFFPKDNGMALERTDIKGSLPFRMRETDELIRVVQMGVAMAVNQIQRQGPARPRTHEGNFLAGNEVF